MPPSLSARLTLQQQAMAAVIVIVLAALSLGWARIEIQREERGAVQQAAQRLAADLEDEAREQGSLAAAAPAIVREELEPGLAVRIRDARGAVVAASRVAAAVRDAGAGPRASVRTAGGGAVEVTLLRSWRGAELLTLARALALVAVPLLLLSFLLSRWLVRRELRPLARMTARSREIASQRSAGPLGVRSGVLELEQLGEAFDSLLARLDERLSAERRFAADASHELRTPLTVLSGELEWLRSQPANVTVERESLGRLAAQVEVMRDLVEAMLLLRQTSEEDPVELGELEVVDLSDVVAAARDAVLARHPERRGDLEVGTAVDVLVAGHPVLLAAGVRNLLDNACKFTSAGVCVRIELEADRETARLRVEDAGEGISPAERERVFDPFYRGARARADLSGAGLGLPILRRVARAHGGDVAVDASPLGGARFTLELPRFGRRRARSARVQVPGAE